MTFLGVDEDRIVRQLMPELRRVTASFEALMQVLMSAAVICLVVYIWRQLAEEQRAGEVHSCSSPKRPCTILSDTVESTEVERLRRENEALKKAVHSKGMTIKQQSEVRIVVLSWGHPLSQITDK